jgi:lipoprotein-anchoring transpeptidase ErfK/SrfK
MAFATIDVTKGITGTIPVANGGTGLASGTADQFLKFTGTTTLASSTLGATGKVLQVVQVEDQTELSLSSNSYTDMGLSASITPSATSSKVLAFWSVHSRFRVSTAGYGARLVRGSTNVWTSTRDYYVYDDFDDNRRLTTFTYLDSPSTTSATTYKIQVATNGSVQVDFNGNENQSNMTLMEIAG